MWDATLGDWKALSIRKAVVIRRVRAISRVIVGIIVIIVITAIRRVNIMIVERAVEAAVRRNFHVTGSGKNNMGSFPKLGLPLNAPICTTILIMGTPKMVPLISGDPYIDKEPESTRF